jgi:hypothetical protein
MVESISDEELNESIMSGIEGDAMADDVNALKQCHEEGFIYS